MPSRPCLTRLRFAMHRLDPCMQAWPPQEGHRRPCSRPGMTSGGPARLLFGCSEAVAALRVGASSNLTMRLFRQGRLHFLVGQRRSARAGYAFLRLASIFLPEKQNCCHCVFLGNHGIACLTSWRSEFLVGL